MRKIILKILKIVVIEVIILYDFVLNYLSLSLIAKSNILSRHFLISAAPMIAFRFPNESHEVMNPLTSASRPEYRLGNWTGSLAIKSAVSYLSAMHFGMADKFVIHCLSLHLFACQSFKFRCNVGIHYAFQARALSPDYIINL